MATDLEPRAAEPSLDLEEWGHWGCTFHWQLLCNSEAEAGECRTDITVDCPVCILLAETTPLNVCAVDGQSCWGRCR